MRKWRASSEQKRRYHFTREKKRAELKAWLINQMGGACNECGYAKDLAALDFDHIDPSTKEHSMARLFGLAVAKDGDLLVLLREAAKCRVLCSNCHRGKTATTRTSREGAKKLNGYKKCIYDGYAENEVLPNPYWDWDESRGEWVRNGLAA